MLLYIDMNSPYQYYSKEKIYHCPGSPSAVIDKGLGIITCRSINILVACPIGQTRDWEPSHYISFGILMSWLPVSQDRQGIGNHHTAYQPNVQLVRGNVMGLQDKSHQSMGALMLRDIMMSDTTFLPPFYLLVLEVNKFIM